MAFFGLTALGSQSPFQGYVDISAFDESELVTAFHRVDKAKLGQVDISKITDIMDGLYHGPAPIDEVAALLSYIRELRPNHDATDEESHVSLASFLEAANKAKETANERVTSLRQKSSTFASSHEYRAQVKRGLPNGAAPKNKYTNPLTVAQEIGWQDANPEERTIVRPRKSCEETKYAAELVRAGAMM